MAEQNIVDALRIRKAAQTGIPLSIVTYTLPHDMEMYMNDVLVSFLKELNQEKMSDYLIYCLNELTTNAKKANTKRVYFQELGLDINNPDDYEKGMKSFKEDTLSNINYYLRLQKEAGLYIKVIFQVCSNKIKLEVRNNARMTIFEYKRVHDKLARAGQYVSMEEAVSQILDDSEGAGLGLIIMILMLRKIGLGENDYQVLLENNETVTRISLPLTQDIQEAVSTLSAEVVDMVEKLPQFPENLTAINKLLDNPDVKLSSVAAQIGNDVALTADLLRLVNSAMYSLKTKCQNIADAVKLVGFKGIKNLIFSVGTIDILKNSTNEQRSLWNHSYMVAFYSYNLCLNFFRKNKDAIEDSYVCGLLHDIGKVVFLTVENGMTDKVFDLCMKQNIASQIFEKMLLGANHEEIGAMIATKWNFPEVIVQTIRYHHKIDEAPAEYKDLATIVDFADMVAHYQDNTVDYYQFSDELLHTFSITNEQQLKDISDKLQDAFRGNSQFL